MQQLQVRWKTASAFVVLNQLFFALGCGCQEEIAVFLKVHVDLIFIIVSIIIIIAIIIWNNVQQVVNVS